MGTLPGGMDSDRIWELEKQFWLEGAPLYEAKLYPDALMVLPGMGIVGRQAIIEGLRDAPRWGAVEFTKERAIEVGDAVVLAYHAGAVREGEGQYQAYCISTYARSGDGWLMVSHQQTPEAP